MTARTILITGASSGIGKGIAHHFLANGYNVVINSKTESKLQIVFEELGGGKNLAMIAGDVGRPQTGEKIVELARERFGSVDILVNNAGIFGIKSFLDVDEAYLNSFMDTNFKGAFFCSQAAIRQMMKQNDGVVINLGSPFTNHSWNGIPHTAQVASKCALQGLTIHLAAEFGMHNIRVNMITPGVIHTPMHGGTEDQMAPLLLLHKVGEVQDVVEMVYTVANSTFITGAVLHVDGGFSSGHNLS